jgi:ABC-type multidrug transport system fused ATPase/permease subunit
MAASVLQSLLLLPVPLLVQRAIDDAIKRQNRQLLIALAVGIVALTAGSGLFLVISQRLVLRATKDATAHIRRNIADRVFATDLATLGSLDPAELHERLVSDAGRIDTAASVALRQLLPAGVLVTGLAIMLVAIDPFLALVTIAAFPLVALATRLFRPRVAAGLADNQRAFEALGRGALLAIRAQVFIRARGTTAAERTAMDSHISGVRETSGTRLTRVAALGALQTTMSSIASAITLIVGGLAVIDGRTTLGRLLSFFAAVALLRGPVGTLAGLAPTLIEGRQSAERIDTFLRRPVPDTAQTNTAQTNTAQTNTAHRLCGGISLERVSYSYPGHTPTVNELSLSLQRGRVTALAGPNGSGKTTTLALLLGLLTPDAGRVTADGQPYDTIDLELLRKQIGVSLQHVMFLPGTVRDNLVYGRAVNEADVARAVRDADAENLVDRLTDGIDTWLGDDGDRLSGGERQRLSIARAVIGRPPVVVLDEPSNHLPKDVVLRILANLRSWNRPPAVLLITHDPVLLEQADAVVTLDALTDDTLR